jgi:RimJ/RimL family protein N-acetyltransferase
MTIETDRLIVRQPVEDDRARFVELFTNEAFMVFSGVLDVDSANSRFDHMLRMAKVVPYAKQPLVDRTTSVVVGYTGADVVDFYGVDRLEWGWRLVEEARGQGLATEAASALLAVADESEDGEMLCLIDSDNLASRRVAEKLGFRWWQRVNWMGDPADPTDVLIRPVGSGGPPLLAPRQAR